MILFVKLPVCFFVLLCTDLFLSLDQSALTSSFAADPASTANLVSSSAMA
ncbi:hypothetical protein AB205_0095340 [Aquarana catesbeiana]|uniref:Uncharacterized protein n=1 Tax=Aquarana catesbeiana TaxID=8400 RepID=A0A2G9Q5K7_AQUCT|nr:hypothetical protein AB205_0095340 [Aquarana catesbeiana]